jgi:hypothetical protein
MVAVAVAAVILGGLTWAQRSGLWWAVYQALELSLHFYPLLAVVALAAILIALCTAIMDRRVWHSRYLWTLLPFAVPFTLLVFGMIFRHTQNDGMAPSDVDQHRLVVEWSPWLHVPFGAVLLACFRSVSGWLIIGCTSTVAVWISFGSGILSWMYVTNICL